MSTGVSANAAGAYKPVSKAAVALLKAKDKVVRVRRMTKTFKCETGMKST